MRITWVRCRPTTVPKISTTATTAAIIALLGPGAGVAAATGIRLDGELDGEIDARLRGLEPVRLPPMALAGILVEEGRDPLRRSGWLPVAVLR